MPGRVLRGVAAVVLAMSLVGCAQQGRSVDPRPAADSSAGGTGSPPPHAVPVREVRMAKPPALSGTTKTVSPDILVIDTKTLPTSVIDGVRTIRGVTTMNSFSYGNTYNEETPVTYAAVNPATFRRFTPAGSALAQDIWDRVAGGELAIREDLAKKVQDKAGYVRLGVEADAPLAHVGAYAPLVSNSFTGAPVIDAVVNEKWVSRLKMTPRNALLVSTGEAAPKKIAAAIKKLVGPKTTVQILAVNLDSGVQTAVLTGGSVTAALGNLRYTPTGGGRVRVDPAWVRSYIRTETVPIIGKVTCNRLMIPELRAALTEIQLNGLASAIHPSQFGGCFVPRYIANTSTLSFHTFGTAVDFNVPENQRGTVGKIDRRVVAILKKWGFGWGGDWKYTDPMHFELHRFVRARS